jgi:hypothetical protein
MPTTQLFLLPVRARSAFGLANAPAIQWNQRQKPRSLLRFAGVPDLVLPLPAPVAVEPPPPVVPEPPPPAPAQPPILRLVPALPVQVEAFVPAPAPAPAPRRSLPLLRPKTRGECADIPRPCPFVSCRHHLALDISRRGVVLVTDPTLGRDINGVETTFTDDNPRPSCSLDVADQGGRTLDEIADMMGLTRERIRQIETEALRAVREDMTMQTFRDDFDETIDVKPGAKRDDAFDPGLFDDGDF